MSRIERVRDVSALILFCHVVSDQEMFRVQGQLERGFMVYVSHLQADS